LRPVGLELGTAKRNIFAALSGPAGIAVDAAGKISSDEVDAIMARAAA
jgi:hypothetical protein